MFTAYIVVGLVTAAANIYVLYGDLFQAETPRDNLIRLGISPSWLLPLTVLKAAGVAGLLIGFGVPWIGVAATTGLVLFFVGAVSAHLRASWYATIGFPSAFLVLAAGTLTLQLASY